MPECSPFDCLDLWGAYESTSLAMVYETEECQKSLLRGGFREAQNGSNWTHQSILQNMEKRVVRGVQISSAKTQLLRRLARSRHLTLY